MRDRNGNVPSRAHGPTLPLYRWGNRVLEGLLDLHTVATPGGELCCEGAALCTAGGSTASLTSTPGFKGHSPAVTTKMASDVVTFLGAVEKPELRQQNCLPIEARPESRSARHQAGVSTQGRADL